MTTQLRRPSSRPTAIFACAAAILVVSACSWPPGGDDAPSAASTTEPLANLRIASATVQTVADPMTCNGSQICLVVTVQNDGDADVSGLEDGCGTSTFGGAAIWASYTLAGAVPAGGRTTFRSGFDQLESKIPATFTLVCEIDAANTVTESNENDNDYTTSVTLP